jgi:hypothetical protein
VFYSWPCIPPSHPTIRHFAYWYLVLGERALTGGVVGVPSVQLLRELVGSSLECQQEIQALTLGNNELMEQIQSKEEAWVVKGRRSPRNKTSVAT